MEVQKVEARLQKEAALKEQIALASERVHEADRVAALKEEVNKHPLQTETKEEILEAVKVHYEENARNLRGKEKAMPKKRFFLEFVAKHS